MPGCIRNAPGMSGATSAMDSHFTKPGTQFTMPGAIITRSRSNTLHRHPDRTQKFLRRQLLRSTLSGARTEKKLNPHIYGSARTEKKFTPHVSGSTTEALQEHYGGTPEALHEHNSSTTGAHSNHNSAHVAPRNTKKRTITNRIAPDNPAIRRPHGVYRYQ